MKGARTGPRRGAGRSRARTRGLRVPSAIHRVVYALLVCLGAAAVYWAATPILEMFPAAVTLPALIAEIDPAMAGLIVAGLVGLMLLTELCSISYCMYSAWKQPRIVYIDDADTGVRGHYRITGRKAKPSSMEPATRHEICAFENLHIVRRRLGLSDRVEIDLLIEDADHLNAYTLGMDTPGGGRHIVCLSSALVETLSTASTAAVIGHELGHVRNKDSARSLFMACFRSFASIILFAPIFIVYYVVSAVCVVLAFIPLLGILAGFFQFLLTILVFLLRWLERIVMYPAHLYEQYVSRQCEYMADAAAAHSVGPTSISRALHLIGRGEDGGKSALLTQVTDKLRMTASTHPAFPDRIEAIRNRTYSRPADRARGA